MCSIQNQPSAAIGTASIVPQPTFTKAKLPIDREAIRSRRLLDMIEQIEVLPARGARTIWELLLDAGADVDHLHYRDPKDDDYSVFHAALQFDHFATFGARYFLDPNDAHWASVHERNLAHEASTLAELEAKLTQDGGLRRRVEQQPDYLQSIAQAVENRSAEQLAAATQH